MKKQSIANRKSLDKLFKDNPAKFEETKRRQRISSAVSALRLYATEAELQQTQRDLLKVQNFLKDHSYLSKEEIKKIRFERFKKKRGRPKQDK